MATSPPLKDSKLVSAGTFNGQGTSVVSEKKDIAAGATANYNVATLLGANAAKYDLTKTQIVVDVLDTEGGSVTNGFYVSAIAAAAVGWKENGQVTITNQHQATQNFYIRIFAFLKPLA